jgi:hypothetical protein
MSTNTCNTPNGIRRGRTNNVSVSWRARLRLESGQALIIGTTTRNLYSQKDRSGIVETDAALVYQPRPVEYCIIQLDKQTAVIGAISTDPSASSARKLHNALVAARSPQQ